MKKKMIQRGLLGFPLGIAIGFVITVIISMCIGDGSFYPVTPELIDTMKNELNAVILQTILCGILGTGFAMASVIWEIDSWSLAKQSGIYFSIACVTMFPIAYITNWMKHNAIGILSYVGIFVAIFVITWLVQYFVWKRKVKRMNDRVRNSKDLLTKWRADPFCGKIVIGGMQHDGTPKQTNGNAFRRYRVTDSRNPPAAEDRADGIL